MNHFIPWNKIKSENKMRLYASKSADFLSAISIANPLQNFFFYLIFLFIYIHVRICKKEIKIIKHFNQN